MLQILLDLNPLFRFSFLFLSLEGPSDTRLRSMWTPLAIVAWKRVQGGQRRVYWVAQKAIARLDLHKVNVPDPHDLLKGHSKLTRRYDQQPQISKCNKLRQRRLNVLRPLAGQGNTTHSTQRMLV
jgi:hypothetical protein